MKNEIVFPIRVEHDQLFDATDRPLCHASLETDENGEAPWLAELVEKANFGHRFHGDANTVTADVNDYTMVRVTVMPGEGCAVEWVRREKTMVQITRVELTVDGMNATCRAIENALEGMRARSQEPGA